MPSEELAQNPFDMEKAKNEKWLEEHRPRGQFPHECAITACPMRANDNFNVIYRGETKRFCSRNHMVQPWQIKEETKKIGRPKGAKNKHMRI